MTAQPHDGCVTSPPGSAWSSGFLNWTWGLSSCSRRVSGIPQVDLTVTQPVTVVLVRRTWRRSRPGTSPRTSSRPPPKGVLVLLRDQPAVEVVAEESPAVLGHRHAAVADRLDLARYGLLLRGCGDRAPSRPCQESRSCSGAAGSPRTRPDYAGSKAVGAFTEGNDVQIALQDLLLGQLLLGRSEIPEFLRGTRRGTTAGTGRRHQYPAGRATTSRLPSSKAASIPQNCRAGSTSCWRAEVSDAPLALALVAGMLAAVNPCGFAAAGLPLLPDRRRRRRPGP